MISVKIRRKGKHISSFTVTDHGDTKVCAAVSLLTLNTVNGIEALTDAAFECEHNPEGGYLQFKLKDDDPQADLILETMLLGLKSVEENYSNDIVVNEM